MGTVWTAKSAQLIITYIIYMVQLRSNCQPLLPLTGTDGDSYKSLQYCALYLVDIIRSARMYILKTFNADFQRMIY